jgi:hypothetical protein
MPYASLLMIPTSHTYKEKIAQIIYEKIPGYYKLMRTLLEKFEKIVNH